MFIFSAKLKARVSWRKEMLIFVVQQTNQIRLVFGPVISYNSVRMLSVRFSSVLRRATRAEWKGAGFFTSWVVYALSCLQAQIFITDLLTDIAFFLVGIIWRQFYSSHFVCSPPSICWEWRHQLDRDLKNVMIVFLMLQGSLWYSPVRTFLFELALVLV